MNIINKQKFLAELGRLLTFMYEEDRQTAIAMYSKMFEDAADEQALLQFLVSPTRQAVVLARSYDSKERKLQVHSQSRDEAEDADGGETPDFVLAIDELTRAADGKGLFSEDAVDAEPQDVNQFSLFEEAFPQEDSAGPTIAEPAMPEFEPIVFEPAPVALEPEQVVVHEAKPAMTPELSPLYDDVYESVPEPAPRVQAAAQNESAEPEDEVDAFLADFSIEDKEQPKVSHAQEASAAPAAREPSPVEAAAEPQFKYTPPTTAAAVNVTQKPKVALLILYIILAIPVTLIGLALLLLVALLCLAIAVGVVSLGVIAVSAVFGGGFAVLADILVLIGISLAVLALGLFFAWLFVWFVGSVIVGFVRGIFRLGRKWCYKEVELG